MYIYKWLKYKYQKKHRYLDAYMQDLITEQSDQVLKPYKIELLTAKKTNKKINEFNYFTYIYEGVKYELLNGKTKTIN
jgi:hypothetical protein